MYNTDRESEEHNLSETLRKIDVNIENNTVLKNQLSEKLKTVSKNEINVLNNYINAVEKALSNNINSKNSPYFAKIDYFDYIENKDCILYIGKCGLEDENEKIITVDWRSPISSAYYDCQPGLNTIMANDEELKLDLKLKRTFEINEGALLDFYDVNTISNDELLTKYLAKNKEAVLGEIVATIQQDQNEIIRESCSKNVIVQGGAGSGKTTVAMHRVSYLLYNYSNIFNTDNFYILGNNEMFLKYITSILPSLDVKDIKYSMISDFLINFIDDYVPFRNGRNTYTDISEIEDQKVLSIKGDIQYILELDRFLDDYEELNIPVRTIKLKNKNIMEKSNIISLLETFKYKSMQEKTTILNKQFAKRLSIELDLLNVREPEPIIAKYSSVFGESRRKIAILDIYKQFLLKIIDDCQTAESCAIDENIVMSIIGNIKKKKFDIFDLACLAMIKRRICTSKDFEDVKHIVIDEAQDFGVSLFYALKNTFTNATYTIVGDVTQNINYTIGMNDWEMLLENAFNESKDKFYVLTKSYRNTIEISNFANNVLKKANFKTYEIEPFVRHGNSVVVEKADSIENMIDKTVDYINKILANGYKTIGIICRDDEQTQLVQEMLSQHIFVNDIKDNEAFTDGVMVMSVALSKGLEFDGVIIFDANNQNYSSEDSDIKLLYVAATRALHELYVLYKNQISELL